jgi:hypothetical protein
MPSLIESNYRYYEKDVKCNLLDAGGKSTIL